MRKEKRGKCVTGRSLWRHGLGEKHGKGVRRDDTDSLEQPTRFRDMLSLI
jgi:hypothetical protein